jgi:predicted ArsR family transcriptional regulator
VAGEHGRVVAQLRRSAQTVNDLAGKLDLTSNAACLHLSALEPDGLVEPHGTRREWTGKPAVVYGTTSEASGSFRSRTPWFWGSCSERWRRGRRRTS